MAVTRDALSTANQLVVYVASQARRVMVNRYSGRSVLGRIMHVDQEIGDKGTQVYIPIDAAVASVLRTDGSPYTQNSDIGSGISLNLDRERHTPVIAKGVALQAMMGNSRAENQLESNINRMLNDVEAEFLAAMVAAAPSANTAGSYGTAATEANIVTVTTALMQQENVPPGNMIGILSPTAWGQISQVANFATAAGANAARTASRTDYGDGTYFHNAEWTRSQGIPAGPASGQYDNVILYPQAAVIASRPIPIPDVGGVVAENIVDTDTGLAMQIIYDYDSQTKQPQLAARMIYNYAVLKAEWIGRLKV